MLPLSDGLPARRFPVVNVLLIVANFAVWLFYGLPNLNAAIFHASFYPSTVDRACHGPLPWGLALYFAGGFVALLTQTAMTLRCWPRWQRRDRCWWWMTCRGWIGPARSCWAS
jgi:hypothetical protein